MLARLGRLAPKDRQKIREFGALPGPLIWLHAVSLGEAKAARGLILLLEERFPEARFVLSTVTRTGGQELQSLCRSRANLIALYLPLDFPELVRPLVQALPPDLLLFVEGDIWLNFLRQVSSLGARIAVVSAKISTRSSRRLSWARAILPLYWSRIDLISAQSERQRILLQKLGCPVEKLRTGGNLKWDNAPPATDERFQSALLAQMGVARSAGVVVIASTHAGEEARLLEACRPIIRQFPDLHFLVAPRHPERFEEVAALLAKFGPITRWSRRSAISGRERRARLHLVDQMGHLIDCYRLGRVAIVGGSFLKGLKGHNILEPMQVGIPPLFGPFMENQTDAVDLAAAWRAGRQVSLRSLERELESLLKSNHLLGALRRGCERACAAAVGSLDQTLWELDKSGALQALESSEHL